MNVSQLAKEFGLSRTALLYYDSIGLLRPYRRTAAGYRCYSESEVERLRQIVMYREAGLSLPDIRRLLDSRRREDFQRVLENRLRELNGDIHRLRLQQNVLVKLLRNDRLLKKTKVMTKDRWVTLFRAAGLDEEMMHKWHLEFETTAPEAHQDFLESLGLSPAEIRRIRRQLK